MPSRFPVFSWPPLCTLNITSDADATGLTDGRTRCDYGTPLSAVVVLLLSPLLLLYHEDDGDATTISG